MILSVIFYLSKRQSALQLFLAEAVESGQDRCKDQDTKQGISSTLVKGLCYCQNCLWFVHLRLRIWVCRMSHKIQFLHSHQKFFPPNLGAASDEQWKKFPAKYYEDGAQLLRPVEPQHDGGLLLDASERHLGGKVHKRHSHTPKKPHF